MISYIFVLMIALSVVGSLFLRTTAEVSAAVLDGAESAVELVISISGMMCLWSGIMQIAKEAKLTQKLSKLFAPLLSKLFPDVSKDSKAFSLICMNVSANLLGLSNAATPLGLQAMQELKTQSDTEVATDSMVNFVVLNTASIQLLPTTVAAMRSALGSHSPYDVIFCVWITSVLALISGLTVSKLCCAFKGSKWSL